MLLKFKIFFFLVFVEIIAFQVSEISTQNIGQSERPCRCLRKRELKLF